MAQKMRKDDNTIEQILRLVDELPPDKQEQLRKTLSKKTWGQRWRQLVKDVENDNKDLPPLTEDEIIAEMKAIREATRSKRAKGSN